MTAKKYLRQIEKLDRCIRQKENEYYALLDATGGISYGERVQTSQKGDSLEKRVIAVMELEEEINDSITSFILLRHRIIDEIQELTVTKHIDVLFKRYVQYKSLEVIAVEMNYSYPYIKELHMCALKEFERTYPNLL